MSRVRQAVRSSVGSKRGFDAWKLRAITHNEGPWRDTPQQAFIDYQAIAAHFAQRRARSG